MTPCPACSGSSFEDLVDFGSIPKSGTYLESPDDEFPRIRLAYEFCAACSLIRQKNIETASHDYTLVPRATTRQFPKYIDAIIASFGSHGVSSANLVIEIGSNDGGFLARMAAAGFTSLLGIEPSIPCAELSIAQGHQVVIKHWAAETAAAVLQERGPARAVVCRHTLEHVPRPLEFLEAIRSILAPDGIVFIEVPDARPITHDLRGHELWDEHLHIFTHANLELIMRRAGFEILRCNAWPERSDINLLLWAKPAPAPPKNSPLNPELASASEVALCREFEKRWKSFSARLQDASATWPRPVYMLGASHPQTNFIQFTRIQNAIDVFIDDNPAKANFLIPMAKPVPIFPTSKLKKSPTPGTILRGAFGYEDWMDSAASPLAGNSLKVVKLYQPRTVPNYLKDQDPLVSLFVACYNEAENIVGTFNAIIQACSIVKISYEIIVIDDASTDNSAEIIKDFIRKNPQAPIQLYVNSENNGLGANFGEAAFKARGLYYRLVCGDNVEPVDTLIKVFSRIGEADIILSYYPDGVKNKKISRKIVSKVYTRLVNLLSGCSLFYYNGLPVFKTNDVRRWNPNSHGFGFQADLITRLIYQGATYIQIPVDASERKQGKPKAITLLNFFSVSHSLLNIFIRNISKRFYGKKRCKNSRNTIPIHD